MEKNLSERIILEVKEILNQFTPLSDSEYILDELENCVTRFRAEMIAPLIIEEENKQKEMV